MTNSPVPIGDSVLGRIDYAKGYRRQRRRGSANPRDAFKGQTADSAWDTLHVGYFTSYALWTYLN